MPEVGVGGAIEDEVAREVDALQRIDDGDGQVVSVEERARLDQFDEEGGHFCGRDEQHVHEDDDDEDQRDTVGALRAAVRRPVAPATRRRPTQRPDQVTVTEGHDEQRTHDRSAEVEPVVGGAQPAAVCHQGGHDVLHAVALLARHAGGGVRPVSRQVDEHARRVHRHDGAGRERVPDE